MENVKKIALPGYYLRGSSLGETIYGRNIAATELLVNLIKYSTAEKLDFCYVEDYYQYQMLKRLTRRLKKQNLNTCDIDIHDRIAIVRGKEKLDSDIIFDCVEDFKQAVFFRDYYSEKEPPISVVIHCASQVDSIINFLTPALFCGLKPYDTFFCSSAAVKRVLEKQLQSLCDRLNYHYNFSIKPTFRMDVVPLGIDDEFKPVEKNHAREELGINQNEFVILYLGRVSAYFKGDIMPMLRVFKNLCNKNENVNLRFVIAGADNSQGEEYSHIQRFVSLLGIDKSVSLFSSFEYSRRDLFFSAADVFVSPTDSIQETFGLTVLEAMACGVPQVVSDWDGYKETVVHGKTGFKVDTYWCECDADISRNAQVLTEEFDSERFYSHYLIGQSVAVDLQKYEYYLQLLIDNPRLRDEMSQNSIEEFRNKYTLKKTIAAYEQVWDELVDIQRKCVNREKKTSDIYNLNYFNAFSHYPTHIIDDNVHFAVTGLGHDLMENNDLIPWHYEKEAAFGEINLAVRIVEQYWGQTHFSMNDLIELSAYNESVSSIKRAVMWLFKHGFIERA